MCVQCSTGEAGWSTSRREVPPCLHGGAWQGRGCGRVPAPRRCRRRRAAGRRLANAPSSLRRRCPLPQLQFQLKGPSGRATVNADMYQDGGAWQYKFLYLDVESPIPQQLVLIAPGQVAAY